MAVYLVRYWVSKLSFFTNFQLDLSWNIFPFDLQGFFFCEAPMSGVWKEIPEITITCLRDLNFETWNSLWDLKQDLKLPLRLETRLFCEASMSGVWKEIPEITITCLRDLNFERTSSIANSLSLIHCLILLPFLENLRILPTCPERNLGFATPQYHRFGTIPQHNSVFVKEK